MQKSQYMILFLIIAVTVINLFYKPWIFSNSSSAGLFFNASSWVSPVTVCPLYGFKCPDDKPCDCKEMCVNGELFTPFHVMEGDTIFLMDYQLTPGTYCLPKGIGNCNQNTSYHVFSATGWKCIPRVPIQEPCKHEDAMDNSKNIVWDYKLSKPAKDIENWYELLSDQQLRYRCQCGSVDKRGLAMIASLPFTCSTDYCLRDIENPNPRMGWNGKECACTTYFHKDPSDKTSPCVMERTRIEKNELIGRVECTSKFSYERKSLYCPPGESVLNFKIPIVGGKDAADYLRVMNL